ncbi:hypothetical protein N8I77_003147 [Diaporthe amygdali]|uniref:Uncharacterized protein n=1 Tax=Phomopsis amygdali TaxID=1214568 RepID=A0AAD9W5H4_PHOAM|nr:hypothetical protein N8I77_003147 [Diaporthe amygdali]
MAGGAGYDQMTYIVLRSTSDLLLLVDPQPQHHLRVPWLVDAPISTSHERAHLEHRLGLRSVFTPSPDGLLDQICVLKIRPKRVPHALRHVYRRRDAGGAVVAVVEIVNEPRPLGRCQEGLEPGGSNIGQAGLVAARSLETRVGGPIPVVLNGEFLAGVENGYIGGRAAGADDNGGSGDILEIFQEIVRELVWCSIDRKSACLFFTINRGHQLGVKYVRLPKKSAM